MGWLRKVGRKISKGLSKVFGSKLGAVIGAVGLYMLMGPVAKTLTGWASSAFGGGAAAAGSAGAQLATTATAEAAAASTIASTTATAGTALTEAQILAGATPATLAAGTSQGISLGSTLSTAGAEIAATTGQAAVGAEAVLAEQALLAGENASLLAGSGSSVIPQTAAQQATSASNLTQAEQIANMTNNMDQANAAISAIDSASVTGSLNVSPTITDSIIQDALPAIEQNAAVVRANVIEMGETITTAPRVSPMDMVTETIDIDASNLVAQQNITAPKIDFTSDTTFIGEGISDTALSKPNLFSRGVDAVTELPGKAWQGVTSGDFVGDVGKGVASSLIMQEIAGEQEAPFRSAGVASKPMSEAAQGNYVQAVAPLAMSISGMTRMPSFQELSQQTLYGTGSPNYLSQFYQPLAAPQAIG
jgi:hypothetical protein